jgi:photosystem II stability/assembly factor-like uncharacterized protein
MKKALPNALPNAFFALLWILPLGVMAQKNQKPHKEGQERIATPFQARLQAFETRKRLRAESLVGNVPLQNIAPTITSGRVVDVAVNENDPSAFLVAYASGGLWLTTSNGSTFSPLFDHQAVMTIGDIAATWQAQPSLQPQTIWVGTGESNSSRSSYAGAGIYKSEDGGKTWQNKGLGETQHISRIILHPTDSNTLWVAAIGHLYSSNPERGVFKTTDGGKTWEKTLFIDDQTGVIDLALDPQNPEVLYAAAWQRSRRAWDFEEAGKKSGLYKSSDGGKTWQKLVEPFSKGFPDSEGVGRIGIAISHQNSNRLYAFLDNQETRSPNEGVAQKVGFEKDDRAALKIQKNALEAMKNADFLQFSDEDINDFLDAYRFPMQYTAQTIREKMQNNQITPKALADFLKNANDDLFNTPIKGCEVYRSDDAGLSWYKTHAGYIDDLIYTYGYYFGNIAISPLDDSKIYLLGVPILASSDGGRTWENINGDNVHVDHHALWVSPKREGHLILGNDGGINISYNNGKNWFKCNTIPVSQFYTVNVDMAEPFNVYGGMQDNGVWYAPHNYRYSAAWQQQGRYPYQNLMGGDGMQVQIDTRDNNIVYTGYQFGNYFRINKATGETKYITPTPILGEKPFRFNWQAPILLSRHNQDVLYLGSNCFHRSLDKGEHFETLSTDLTQGGKKGDVPYGTLTSISESPLKLGYLYVGSDDGLVHVSKDMGYTWERVSDNLPAEVRKLNLWVSRVEASHHALGRVYLTLNGYRYDHFEAYLFVSEDFGKSWRRLGVAQSLDKHSSALPAEPINVVKEDPHNENILYVGTDHSLYLSLDRGKTFMGVSSDLPDVAVHDLAIQARDKKLVVATHGRSLWLMDLQHIESLTPALLEKPLHLYPLQNQTFSKKWGDKANWWQAENEPTLEIAVWAAEAQKATIFIKKETETLYQFEVELEKGLNFIPYHLETTESSQNAHQGENGKFYLSPFYTNAEATSELYRIEIKTAQNRAEQVFEIFAPQEAPSRRKQKKTP